MIARKYVAACRRNLRLRRPLQIVLIFAFWQAGNFLVRLSGLPVPGGIVGMVLVLVLFASGRLSPASLRHGANWFIAEMLLFFVPAVLAVMDHREFLGFLGLKLLAAVLLGTIAVMIITALSVDLCFRLMYAPAFHDQGSDPHAVD